MPTIADSALHVPPSRIREIAEAAMKMDGVLKLYFGESNIPTPEYIKRAASAALQDGYTFYTENAGLPGLRQDLADAYLRLQGVTLDPRSEIVVTASGVQALNVGIRCALDPGDEALVLTPAWPNASAIIRMDNATPIEIPLRLRNGRYAIDFQALQAALTPRTRLLVYTSPSNPLGWVATLDEQERLLGFARRHDLWLLADEVYDRLYYRGPEIGVAAPSILRMATRADAVMVAQSFSNAFCWKLLQETRVGIAPGVAFGAGGEGSVRICYAAERAILEPAMERLARFLSESWG